MVKLVVLSEGMTGKTYELKVDKTTVGRVDDNTFQIAQPSVSSHHCEVLLRGNDVVVKDLNSTNGTYINGQQVTGEAVLKPGQVLRLGEVEIRLESGAPAAAPKRPLDSTLVIPKGVTLEQLEQGAQGAFDTSKGGFSKKENSTNRWFIIGGIVFIIVIGVLFMILYSGIKPGGH